MRRLVIAISACWGLVAAEGWAAAEAPRTVAFVVGVQQYDDADLNKLQYVARDAEDVFRQFEAVTDLDLSRSRLLIAVPGASDDAQPGDPGYLLRKAKLSEDLIRTEFRRFLHGVAHNDTVLIYLGGHGTTQAKQHLLFLPSDYQRRPRQHYLRYVELLEEIKGRIDDERLRNVKVAFFANMCGAGTGAGEASVAEDPDAEFVQGWLERNSIGFDGGFAFFPASAANRNTYESDEFGRSILARHLLDGLSGAAAKDGVITSGELFRYLDAQIEDDLPRHPTNFNETIEIGVTREQEATAAYALGMSLLAVGRDTQDSLFFDLARREFGRVALLSATIKGLAQFRAAQTMALAGADAEVLRPALAKALADTRLPPSERSAAEELLQKLDSPPALFPSLASLAEALRGGTKFRAIVLCATCAERNLLEVRLWQQVLAQFAGAGPIDVIVSGRDQPATSTADDVLKRIGTAVGSETPATSTLLLIVSVGAVPLGPTGFEPALAPVLGSATAAWPGPTIVVHTGPGGGRLLEAAAASGSTSMSLFLSGTEVNAMSFTNRPDAEQTLSDSTSDLAAAFVAEAWSTSTSALMAQALYEGVADLASWPRYLAYRQRIEAEYDPAASQGQERRQNWVIGIPTWIADAATGRDPILGARSATTRQLAPLDRWSVLLAGGCVRGPLASCPAASAPAALGVGGAPAVIAPSSSDGPGVPVAFEYLRQAARHDLSGAISEASDAYRRFLDELAPLLDQAEHASGVGLETVLQRSAHDPIERLAQKARQRLNGLEGKADRRVVVLSVAVQDYRSPLVADLRHTADDIAVWRDSYAAA